MKTLQPHQQNALKFLCSRKRSNLFNDPGTGKTGIVVKYIECLRKNNADAFPILLLAPLKVIQYNWLDVFPEWTDIKFKTIFLHDDSFDLYDNQDIVFCNFEGVKKLDTHPKTKDVIFKTTIIDESSFIRNMRCWIRETKKSRTICFGGRKLLAAVGKRCLKSTRHINMTGSLAPNGYENLWASQFLIDQGKTLETSFGSFQEKYFQPIPSKSRFVKWKIIDGKEDIILDKIKSSSFVVRTEDCLETYGEEVIPYYVELDKNSLEKHKEMFKNMVVSLSNKLPNFKSGKLNLNSETIVLSDEIIKAGSIAGAITKCLQIASGHIYTEDKKAIFLHDCKLDVLSKMVEESNTPILAVYKFISDRDRILEKIKGAEAFTNDFDETFQDRWDKGEIPLLVVNARSAGFGLSLHKPCHKIVFYTPEYDYDSVYQMIQRVGIARQAWIKSQKKVEIYFLLAKKTLDIAVFNTFLRKQDTQEEIKKRLSLAKEA